MSEIEAFLAKQNLFRCERLSANLTVAQCEANRKRETEWRCAVKRSEISTGDGLCLSRKQQEALERFPVGEWVTGYGTYISTLKSLVKRGLLQHKPNPDIPNIIFAGRNVPWCQHLKMGTFCRQA